MNGPIDDQPAPEGEGGPPPDDGIGMPSAAIPGGGQRPMAPASPAYAAAPPPPAYVVAPPPQSARRGRRAATALAVTIALVAGGFGVMQLTATDGPKSPDEAVRAFFDAVDHEDVIGVLEALEPSERQILRDAVDATVVEGKRVKVASDDLDLHKVQGLDLHVDGLKMGVTPLRDGLSAVDLADGSVSTAADLEKLPVGPVIREVLDRRRNDPNGDGLDQHPKDRIELSGVRLATVRTDGAWHVSVLYSIAEQVRTDAKHVDPFPTGPGVAPKGAASPEAAVREAVDAIIHHDARRLIELAPAEEMAVLHEYGPLILKGAEDWQKEDQNIKVSNLQLATNDGPRGAKVVSAKSFDVHTEEDFGGGDNQSIDWSYDGKCTTSTYTSTYAGGDGSASDGSSPNTQKWCVDDQDRYSRDPFSLFLPFGVGVSGPGDGLRIVAEEHDGSWYLSPSRSLFETVLTIVRDVSPDQARRFVRVFFGDDDWLSAPPEFWEACKVADPGLDASRAEGEKAYQACEEALPADYAGDHGWQSFSRLGEGAGVGLEGDPTAACPDGPGEQDLEGAAFDAAYTACLKRLFDAGKVDGSQLVFDQCQAGWDDWYAAHPDGEPTEAEGKALDDATQRCEETTPVPTRPDGSSDATAAPRAPEPLGPGATVNKTEVEPATTSPSDGPSTSSQTGG